MNLIRLLNLTINPKQVRVRNLYNISISFSLDCKLPQNSYLTFRFRGGRNNKNDWYLLQAEDPNADGYANLKINKSVKMIPMVITGKELLIKYLICEPDGIEKKTLIEFTIKQTLAQSLEELKKKIEIIIDFPNRKQIVIENPPLIDVIHNNFDHITIICPSLISVNDKFKVLLRIEDKFKNLVKDFGEKIKIYQIYENSKRNLIAEVDFSENGDGLARLDGFSFSEPGIYHIEGLYDNRYFRSNPISCREGRLKNKLYWGFIHGHTNKSDGMRDLEEYFQNLLNAGLDFGTSTEHDHKYETSDDDFKEIKEVVKKFHQEGEFVSIFGYEYGTWYSGYGDICIYHYDNDIPIMRSEMNKYNSTSKLNKKLNPYEGKVLLIAHHTALRPGFRNWDYFNNDVEKLVEIYSTWGNQEYSYKDGNPIPPRYKFFGHGKHARKRGAILEKKESFVTDALKRGYKLGFTAGGDDHFGMYPSGSIDPDNGIYPPGIMAIWADDLSKKALWDALNNRKCYGTTGPRVIVEFHLNKHFMGDIIDINKEAELNEARIIAMEITSPVTIERIELIRNDVVIKNVIINSKHAEITHMDTDIFENIAIEHSNKEEMFVYYYTRIFLANNNMAWSSPIWIIK